MLVLFLSFELRIGGGNYQVPVEVRPERQQALALRWLVQYAKTRNGKGMAENLACLLVLLQF